MYNGKNLVEMGEFRKNNVVASKRRVGFHCYRTLRACACCCYCVSVRVVRLGGQVGLGLAIEGIERLQRAKPLAFPSSYVAPTYENSVLVH